MNSTALTEQLRELRLKDKFAQARGVIRGQPGFARSRPLQRLLLEHEDFWWAPLVGRRVTLKRRGPDDAAFVRACWADADFMRRFNRVARPLPADDKELRGILARERAALFTEARALHWTVHGKDGPLGFVSVTDYFPAHRRAEFLIGFLGQPPSIAPVEAAHIAVRFLEEQAGLERLTAYFYSENEYAAKVAEKFGFRREGVLRSYMRDDAGTRSDLIVAGMLLGEHADPAVKRLRDRVLSAPAQGGG